MKTIVSGTYIGNAGTYSSNYSERTGGTGLVLPNNPAGDTLASTAVMTGGVGYHATVGNYLGVGIGGDGGVGINIAGGALTNFGSVAGGHGGDGMAIGAGGKGGVGIRFASFGTLVNHGKISGGASALGGRSGGVNPGGIAVDFVSGGILLNQSQITGGNGAYHFSETAINSNPGGTGAYFGAKGILLNSGTVSGGAGGGSYYSTPAGAGGTGVEMKAAAFIANAGLISGGGGAEPYNGNVGGQGGTGIKLDKYGVVLNSGSIAGGKGGDVSSLSRPFANGGKGGVAIAASAGGYVLNAGKITGGNGGAPGYFYPGEVFNLGADGADGVDLGGGYLTNFGVIAGGNGGPGGGKGGDGVVLSGTRTAAYNYGSIFGGNGSSDGIGSSAYAGTGVDMVSRGLLVNFGTISAGQGTLGNAADTVSGIYLAGGSTLVNDGIINGPAQGFAVQFGNAGLSHLVIDAGARFSGTVAAGGSGNEMELTGHKFGTLTGLNQGFGDGFQTLQVDAHSSWSVSGVIADLRDAGLIEIAANQKLDITGAVDPASAGTFVLTGKSSLEIAELLGSSSQIAFLGASPANLLTIDKPADFGLHANAANYTGPLLEDFKAGNMIDLKGIGNAGLQLKYNASTGLLQVTTSSGGVVASLHFQTASLAAGSFHLAADTTGGSVLTRS